MYLFCCAGCSSRRPWWRSGRWEDSPAAPPRRPPPAVGLTSRHSQRPAETSPSQAQQTDARWVESRSPKSILTTTQMTVLSWPCILRSRPQTALHLRSRWVPAPAPPEGRQVRLRRQVTTDSVASPGRLLSPARSAARRKGGSCRRAPCLVCRLDWLFQLILSLLPAEESALPVVHGGFLQRDAWNHYMTSSLISIHTVLAGIPDIYWLLIVFKCSSWKYSKLYIVCII